jgi:Tol biopolymer transport system component
VSSRADGTWELFSIAVNSGAATQLTQGGGMAPRALPDGRSILFVKPHARGLWRFDLATRVTTLVTGAVGGGDCTNWDVSSNGVYFVRRNDDGQQSIVSFAFAGGALSVVRTSVRVPVGSGGLSVTSDGRALAYAQVDRRDGDLVTVTPAR